MLSKHWLESGRTVGATARLGTIDLSADANLIGMVCGIFGGMVVCALTLDISPTMFLSIMQNSNGLQHFLVG